jgi:hypothetical protein
MPQSLRPATQTCADISPDLRSRRRSSSMSPVTATEAGLPQPVSSQIARRASCRPNGLHRSRPAPVAYNSGTIRAWTVHPPDRTEVSRRLLGTSRVRLGSPCCRLCHGDGGGVQIDSASPSPQKSLQPVLVGRQPWEQASWKLTERQLLACASSIVRRRMIYATKGQRLAKTGRNCELI